MTILSYKNIEKYDKENGVTRPLPKEKLREWADNYFSWMPKMPELSDEELLEVYEAFRVKAEADIQELIYENTGHRMFQVGDHVRDTRTGQTGVIVKAIRMVEVWMDRDGWYYYTLDTDAHPSDRHYSSWVVKI